MVSSFQDRDVVIKTFKLKLEILEMNLLWIPIKCLEAQYFQKGSHFPQISHNGRNFPQKGISKYFIEAFGNLAAIKTHWIQCVFRAMRQMAPASFKKWKLYQENICFDPATLLRSDLHKNPAEPTWITNWE